MLDVEGVVVEGVLVGVDIVVVDVLGVIEVEFVGGVLCVGGVVNNVGLGTDGVLEDGIVGLLIREFMFDVVVGGIDSVVLGNVEGVLANKDGVSGKLNGKDEETWVVEEALVKEEVVDAGKSEEVEEGRLDTVDERLELLKLLPDDLPKLLLDEPKFVPPEPKELVDRLVFDDELLDLLDPELYEGAGGGVGFEGALLFFIVGWDGGVGIEFVPGNKEGVGVGGVDSVAIVNGCKEGPELFLGVWAAILFDDIVLI